VAKTSDGVSIYYEVIGKGERTLMLANGLGGRLYAWEPLIESLFEDYRFIVWDYRGLFGSSCEAGCKLSVRDHAQDAFRVLDNEGIRRAAWIGWSMGVQVLLEAASLDASRVAGLVLLNGTWGHVFSSALQPGLRFPIMTRTMHELLEWVRRHPELTEVLAVVGKHGSFVTVGVFWLLLGRRAMMLEPMLQQYMTDIFKPENFPNYLRLFQELDAHSAFHHLPEIDVPALVVSGRFDVLTPPYQSREIARRLAHAERLHVRNGSHFVLIERPEQVVPRVERFLRERVKW
jgi:pimeloyl-ACP methyl ester carboxylesterase